MRIRFYEELSDVGLRTAASKAPPSCQHHLSKTSIFTRPRGHNHLACKHDEILAQLLGVFLDFRYDHANKRLIADMFGRTNDFWITPPSSAAPNHHRYERDARPPDLSGEPKHCPLTRTQHTETPQAQECCHLRRCWRPVAFAASIVGKHDSRKRIVLSPK